ncbi:MAG: hypothetical protein QF755_01385 [Candidatus Peribacteraceae bacterium]|jgi:hypothetical protein|nr:hypothetical protein [Candidatus Peribacteraceae bacterium]|tara:strand:+ start:100 stop:909 length:810 start_codon:yes stop_codon:yes gene_type:complete
MAKDIATSTGDNDINWKGIAAGKYVQGNAVDVVTNHPELREAIRRLVLQGHRYRDVVEQLLNSQTGMDTSLLQDSPYPRDLIGRVATTVIPQDQLTPITSRNLEMAPDFAVEDRGDRIWTHVENAELFAIHAAEQDSDPVLCQLKTERGHLKTVPISLHLESIVGYARSARSISHHFSKMRRRIWDIAKREGIGKPRPSRELELTQTQRATFFSLEGAEYTHPNGHRNAGTPNWVKIAKVMNELCGTQKSADFWRMKKQREEQESEKVI